MLPSIHRDLIRCPEAGGSLSLPRDAATAAGTCQAPAAIGSATSVAAEPPTVWLELLHVASLADF